MYVPPRPDASDDPWFSIRLAFVPVIGTLLAMWLGSPLALLYPVMMFGLIAGSRKAFNLVRTIAAPIMFSTAVWLMSFVVMATQSNPPILITIVALLLFLAFYVTQMTGSAAGMLILAAVLMMTIIGISSYQTMDIMRIELTKASFATAFVAPILYWLLPTKTTELHVDSYIPADPHGRATKSAIRAAVLLVLALYLYTILDSSNIMLAIGAMFVIIFPTRETLWKEALERSVSTVIGGVMGLLVLGLLMVSSHLVVLLATSFFGTLWFTQRMVDGKHSAMFYQNGASVMLSIVGGGLATSEPMFSFIQRAALTAVGAIAAAMAVIVLEALLVREKDDCDDMEGHEVQAGVENANAAAEKDAIPYP